MTLHEALRALVASGRLRSRWLPGMLLVADGPIRLIGIRLHEEAIASFERAADDLDTGWDRAQHVLTDPATVGCLLALLREAAPQDDRRQPYAVVEVRSIGWEFLKVQIVDRWSEGKVIAAALIDLAQDKPPASPG